MVYQISRKKLPIELSKLDISGLHLYSINRVFLLSGFFAYRMFLLLLRIIFDFTIFSTQIHRFFLHHFFAYRVFLPHFCHFSTTICFFPKKFRIFLSFCFFLVFLFTIGSSFCSTSLSISWITLLLPLYPSRSALVSKRNFGMTCYSSLFLVVLSAL